MSLRADVGLPRVVGLSRFETDLQVRSSDRSRMPSAAPLSEVTYQRWKRLGLDLCRAGGRPRDLIHLLGLSQEQWASFMDAVHERARPRKRAEGHPIIIPPTSPTSYVSFRRALNLCLPGEWTGGLDFEEYYFGYVEPTVTPLAGPGGRVDSTPSLGSKGVRDMGRIIADRKIQPYNGPVYVANHYRALADLALSSLTNRPIEHMRETEPKSILSAWEVNDMLNSDEDQIQHLVEEYLKPLRSQLPSLRKEAYDRWLPTIVVHT